MKVWEIIPDPDTYDCVNLADLPDVVQLVSVTRKFGFKELAAVWIPFSVVIERRGRAGDFPSFGGSPPVFTERAVNILLPLIQDSIQLLPLRCDTESLYGINVIEVVDCLDHTRSQFVRFTDGGIMRVEKYVFKEGCIGEKHIFRIPEQRVIVFVSDAFKQAVEDNQLEGLRFFPVG